MNCIVLEGVSIYLTVILLVLIISISFACIICAVNADRRLFTVNEMLKTEREKNEILNKENFRLKLKYGELNCDE